MVLNRSNLTAAAVLLDVGLRVPPPRSRPAELSVLQLQLLSRPMKATGQKARGGDHCGGAQTHQL
jgi:hypothetical protein